MVSVYDLMKQPWDIPDTIMLIMRSYKKSISRPLKTKLENDSFKKINVAFAAIAFQGWWTDYTSRFEYHGEKILKAFKSKQPQAVREKAAEGYIAQYEI